MSNGINLIGIPKFQHPWRPLQSSRNSGTWENRGKGNEMQSALEKGLSWVGDKFANAEDYFEDAFNYLVTAPLAVVTGKTKEIPRVINLLREARHDTRVQGAVVPFDLISPIKGGWMLKGLMKGSPLEKALSKTGTININSLQAYLNKASRLEQYITNKVLNSRFAGQKNIDYNDLRKAVSDELIRYNRNYNAQSTIPNMSTEDLKVYGGDNLGLIKKSRISDGAGGLVTTYEQKTPVTFRQFTFEAPQITKGNNKHYTGSPLGHSRTYTTLNEPDVLHVMESQSDWGLGKILGPYSGTTAYLNDPEAYRNFIDGHKRLLAKMLQNPENYIEGAIERLIANIKHHEDILNLILNGPDIQTKYLHDNYLPRLLQENMIFAAEQGLRRMRYPTPETAARIEGFLKTEKTSDFLNTELELDRLIANRDRNLPDEIDIFDDSEIFYTDEYRNALIRDLENKLAEMQLNFTDRVYPKEEQTIVNKYAEFPKMFNKLFKGLEVRTITDPKGNTWYEVDIPENFLLSEWLFKKGGVLGLNKIIGL